MKRVLKKLQSIFQIFILFFLFFNTLIANEHIKLTSIEENYLQQKDEVIKVCIDPDWMPFEKLNKGKHIGITRDYFDYFEEVIGKKFEAIHTKDWSDTLNAAKTRRCDILTLAMASKEREAYMNFTQSYIRIPIVMATRSEATFVDSLYRLKEGTRIGLTKDYVPTIGIETLYPHINFVEVTSAREGIQKVAKGELFGTLESLATLLYIIREDYYQLLKINTQLDRDFLLSVGVRNDELILLSIFEKAVESIPESLKNDIYNKWIPIEYHSLINYRYVWLSLIIVSVIFGCFLIWNRTLQKKINLAIQEHKKQEALLLQQARMAETGSMIGAIAHQLKQPLNIINIAMFHLELILDIQDKQQKEFIQKTIDETSDQVLFMSNTIEEFQNFYRNSDDRLFSPSQSAEKIKTMFKGIFEDEDVTIEIRSQDKIQVYGSENNMMQVFLTLFNNTREAVKNQGTRKTTIHCLIEQDEDDVIILIQDNAGGIPKELLPKKLFCQYVSTKGTQGTGLGLHITHNIITKKFNGKISVQNIDNGCEFEIRIPKVHQVKG